MNQINGQSEPGHLSMINSVGVTSPSANINETENEQEMLPFKPNLKKNYS